jgi:hypothetical protein
MIAMLNRNLHARVSQKPSRLLGDGHRAVPAARAADGDG